MPIKIDTNMTQPRFKSSPFNPRTGHPWTLVDEELIARVDAFHDEVTSSPEKARQFLIKHGFLTPSGNTPKKYRTP